jgi:nucleoside-diphosphate-sugar epimerase
MKVLITGGGGFLGSNLVKFLSERSEVHEIFSVGFSQLKRPEFPKERYYALDLRNREFCGLFFYQTRPDWVFDFASVVGGFEFNNSQSALILHDATMMNLNVLDCVKEYGVKKFLFASTACVYPKEANFLKEESAYPINPENYYGLQKIFMENVIAEYAKSYGFEVYLARLQNVYGPYIQFEGYRAKGLADICRKMMLADKSVVLKGDGRQVRDYTYSEDAMEGIWKLAHTDFHKPLNICSGKAVTIHEYATTIMKVLGKKLEIGYDHQIGKGVFRRMSSNQLAKKVIDWEPSTPLEAGIRKMVDWMEKEMKK